VGRSEKRMKEKWRKEKSRFVLALAFFFQTTVGVGNRSKKFKFIILSIHMLIRSNVTNEKRGKHALSNKLFQKEITLMLNKPVENRVNGL
jgi:hypothetical protein